MGIASLSRKFGGLVIDHGSHAIVRGISHEGVLTVDRGADPVLEGNQLLDTCVEVWGEGTVAEFRKNTVTRCPSGPAFDIAHGASPLIEDNDISTGGISIYRCRGTDSVGQHDL